MKKIYQLVFCFCLASVVLSAQKVPDPLEPAYVVTLKKDTIKGYIVVINKLARQEQITFYTNPLDVKTRHFYEADRIKGYGVNGDFYEPIAYKPDGYKYEKNFAIVKKRGKLSLYTWYSFDPYSRTEKKTYKPMELIDPKDLVEEPLVKKGAMEVKSVKSSEFINFKKQFSEYLKESKELSKKIADKELKIEDIETIVDMYNASQKRR